MSVPESLPWAPIARALTTTYGLPPWSFREFAFWRLPGEPGVYLAVAGASHPETPEALLNIGWLALTDESATGVPTLALLRIIGPDATRNVVEVDADGEARFARGEGPSPQGHHDADVVIVRRGRRVLGGIERATGRVLA